MIETSQVVGTFGFDPDTVFPNRDFWFIEDGRLIVTMPPPAELLSEEERGLLETVTVDPRVYDNFLGSADAEGNCVEYVFVPVGDEKVLAALKTQPNTTDAPVPELRSWVARVLQKFFGG